MKKNKRTSKPLRMAAMAAVLAAVIVGSFWHSGAGSLSAFGVAAIAAICPLGFLETALAARGFVPWLLVPFLVIAAITAAYGRVFCGWVCPVPLVRSWLPDGGDRKTKRGKGNRRTCDDDKVDAGTASEGRNGERGNEGNGDLRLASGSSPGERLPACNGLVDGHGPSLPEPAPADAVRPWPALSVLAGTLLSASIFGFPVFCLVCPIGLIFGTGFAAVHLVRTGQPSIDLLVFPAIVVVELVVLKKWCANICPLGALLGLFAIFHRGLAPRVDRSRCLVDTKSSRCQECRKACAFAIELRKPAFEGGLNECVKCRECADHCPVKAIRFPWWSR